MDAKLFFERARIMVAFFWRESPRRRTQHRLIKETWQKKWSGHLFKAWFSEFNCFMSLLDRLQLTAVYCNRGEYKILHLKCSENTVKTFMKNGYEKRMRWIKVSQQVKLKRRDQQQAEQKAQQCEHQWRHQHTALRRSRGASQHALNLRT